MIRDSNKIGVTVAQNFVPKQTGFVNRYVGAIQNFLDLVDSISLMNTEFVDNAYGTGGQNAIPDAVVQSALPAATALQFNEAEGAMVTILATVTSNRGFLENMRP